MNNILFILSILFKCNSTMPDTIVALATPTGRSGIGVVRLSGADALAIARQLLFDDDFEPEPRTAHLKRTR